ncbi:hypothetical protein COP2_022427 [Malus domestica]
MFVPAKLEQRPIAPNVLLTAWTFSYLIADYPTYLLLLLHQMIPPPRPRPPPPLQHLPLETLTLRFVIIRPLIPASIAKQPTTFDPTRLLHSRELS